MWRTFLPYTKNLGGEKMRFLSEEERKLLKSLKEKEGFERKLEKNMTHDILEGLNYQIGREELYEKLKKFYCFENKRWKKTGLTVEEFDYIWKKIMEIYKAVSKPNGC